MLVWLTWDWVRFFEAVISNGQYWDLENFSNILYVRPVQSCLNLHLQKPGQGLIPVFQSLKKLWASLGLYKRERFPLTAQSVRQSLSGMVQL